MLNTHMTLTIYDTDEAVLTVKLLDQTGHIGVDSAEYSNAAHFVPKPLKLGNW
jgi:hypothetical protein